MPADSNRDHVEPRASTGRWRGGDTAGRAGGRECDFRADGAPAALAAAETGVARPVERARPTEHGPLCPQWRARETTMLSLNINGHDTAIRSDPATPLLWVLRCELKLTGTKFGCGVGVCGACTLHIDGAAQTCCTKPVAQLHGTKITTIEGLGGAQARALKSAW